MKALASSRRIPLLFVLMAGAGLFYLGWTNLGPAEATDDTLQTTTVREGDLRITVGGRGNLVADATLDLEFQISGVLSETYVDVGDEVQGGDILARLDDRQAELEVRKAQLDWLVLTSPQVIADAEVRLLEYEQDLAEAQERRDFVRDGPPQWYYEALLDQAMAEYLEIESALAAARASNDRKAERELGAQLDRAEQAVEEAQADLEWVLNYQPNPLELAFAQAQVDLAAARLAAQDALLEVLQGGSLEAAETATRSNEAMRELEYAALALDRAQWTLEQTMLIAPTAGIITGVYLPPGVRVDGEAVLTLTVLDPLRVRFYLDEADLAWISAGDLAEITFDAYPDQTFEGRVAAIDPALVKVDGSLLAQVWGELDFEPELSLLPGMGLEVEVLAAESKATLIVPLQALFESEHGSYAVYVLDEDGNLEMRQVTVGLRDFANAEILSGLEAGERVSLEP